MTMKGTQSEQDSRAVIIEDYRLPYNFGSSGKECGACGHLHWGSLATSAQSVVETKRSPGHQTSAGVKPTHPTDSSKGVERRVVMVESAQDVRHVVSTGSRAST
ncbi:hypothetical protein PTTG_28991 [Puccinia triticina 1-1 BBBD Race 1]|uniref:Uncharacterized protein n=1 Tax=Puccinia triticina (isolate 1-1 / race 1 (BBBD)) TaxID=630390 RepID=A0A180G7X8_PUCT1|nr:hypothetical protein PTTG_28991 [Puccinia triticina 1-1 BBBD Race 1]